MALPGSAMSSVSGRLASRRSASRRVDAPRKIVTLEARRGGRRHGLIARC
jgi:hypothetical protein